jgi:transcriptional regulator with XRE-family HTH domain
MGRAARQQPDRLAEKLYAIRTRLDLTQEQMIQRLRYTKSTLYPSSISEFEQGKREPPVLVLLHYARAVGINVEILIDDALDLPKKLS